MKLLAQKVFIAVLVVCFSASLLDLHPTQADNTILLTAFGTPYFQDFNSLSNSSESATVPVGWVLSETRGNANNLYKVNNGTLTTGDTYSFGSTNSTDRALGGIQESSLLPLFGASFTNHVGGIIQSMTIKYTGEEWRYSRLTRADKLILEISTDATSLGNGNWTRFDNLIFITPYQSIVGSRDGNDPINRAYLQYTVTGLSIDPGKTFWIRWTDYDAVGEDDGLAIDDFSLTPFGTDNALTLVDISPSNNAINVSLDSNISVSFSEPVNLSDGWLNLSCSISQQHSFILSGGPQMFVVNPVSDFIYGDSCTISIISAKVADQDNADPPDSLDKDYSFSFSIIPPPDAAPIVTHTSPANNETAVLLNSGLTIQFSEPVAISQGWFNLNCSMSGTHPAVVDGGPSTFIIIPQNTFQFDENCTFSINASKIADLDANDPPDLMPSDFSLNFSTVSSPDVAPFIVSSIPENNAESVPVNQTIELTFSEPVSLISGAISVICESGNEAALKISGGPTTFQVKPDHDLGFEEQCAITIVAQNVSDQDSKDPPDNMLLDQTISFETEVNPDSAPSITQSIPTNGAANVGVNSNLTLTFNEEVITADSWAELKCSVSGEHSFGIGGTPYVIVINPDIDFANNESCTLTILASKIHDLDILDPPDVMSQDNSITFSTAPATDLPPTIIETYPSNHAKDVPIGEEMSVTFSEPVYLMVGWDLLSCTKSQKPFTGTHNGPIKYSFGVEGFLSYSENCTVTLKADKIYDLDANDPPDFLSSDYTFSFTTVKSPDELSAPTIVENENTIPNDGDYLQASFYHLFVQFSKDVLHDGSPDAADNPKNYRLLEWGANKVFDTTSCENTSGFDGLVPIDNIRYDGATFKADLTVNHEANLPEGTYRLIICGDHTIRDLYGNPLNGGTNSTITFTITSSDVAVEPTDVVEPTESDSDEEETTPPTSETTPTAAPPFSIVNATPNKSATKVLLIPVTGFPRGVVTLLEPQLTSYADLGDLWLEVPTMDLNTSIIGVPKKDGTWDVSWLGGQAGWLGGSALPGMVGNSVLTGHVWDALNRPGVFYGLEKLKYGDQVIVHAWGDEYVYEVREVLSVKPENVDAMMKHQEKAWLTLVTCQGYDEDSGEYQHRILVRAVLMEVR